MYPIAFIMASFCCLCDLPYTVDHTGECVNSHSIGMYSSESDQLRTKRPPAPSKKVSQKKPYDLFRDTFSRLCSDCNEQGFC